MCVCTCASTHVHTYVSARAYARTCMTYAINNNHDRNHNHTSNIITTSSCASSTPPGAPHSDRHRAGLYIYITVLSHSLSHTLICVRARTIAGIIGNHTRRQNPKRRYAGMRQQQKQQRCRAVAPRTPATGLRWRWWANTTHKTYATRITHGRFVL